MTAEPSASVDCDSVKTTYLVAFDGVAESEASRASNVTARFWGHLVVYHVSCALMHRPKLVCMAYTQDLTAQIKRLLGRSIDDY